MRKTLIALGLCIGIWAVEAGAEPFNSDGNPYQLQRDSVTLDYLVGMDKRQFKGKTLAEFLASPEAKGYQELLFRHTPDGVLEGMRIKYSSNLYLNVYVRDFQHLQPQGPKSSWNMDALKKEIIDEIRVVYVMHEGQQ